MSNSKSARTSSPMRRGKSPGPSDSRVSSPSPPNRFHADDDMQIRVGYELRYDLPQPTPIILTLHVHYTRVSDLVWPDHMISTPAVPMAGYRDGFGNWCTRLIAPPGQFRVSANAIVNDAATPDPVFPTALQHPIPELPEETLLF